MTDDLSRAALETALEPLRNFLSRVAGAPGSEVGELLADRIRFRRFRNQIRMLQKAEELLGDAGLDAQEVPLNVLAPLLDAAGNEDDATMSDRWAALLANAASDSATVPPSFPAILRELTPIEAAIVDALYQRLVVEGERPPGTSPDVPWQEIQLSRDWVRSMHALSETDYEVVVQNLFRLRLVIPPYSAVGRGLGAAGTRLTQESTDGVRLTELGRAFVEACSPPSATSKG